MPSISCGSMPASAQAFLIASIAMESGVRPLNFMCGVSPTPTMQYLSVRAPILHVLLNAGTCVGDTGARGARAGHLEIGGDNEGLAAGPSWIPEPFRACQIAPRASRATREPGSPPFTEPGEGANLRAQCARSPSWLPWLSSASP